MKKPGFTFLELLISLSHFTVGMMSVLQIFPLNRRFLAQSANLTQATFLAQEEVEQVRLVSYTALTVGTYEALHALGSGTSDPLNQFSRTTIVSLVDPTTSPSASPSPAVTYSVPGADKGMKRADITVSWQEGSTSRSYTISTYVNQN